ncbi:MAG: transposase [Candidatus Hydrogenedentes bacterium]|nr:transposase [Candidatus Hydrogenedentota bacterium]
MTQRGNYRQDVFFTDDDRRVYLSFLRESARQCHLTVTAYCLMTNHVHLVATPEREDSLSRALGRTHLMYAQYIHRFHARLGHLWQSRFYSCPLDDAHAFNAAAYVELNPVRAGMVELAWDCPWSSAGAHCGEHGGPARLLDLAEWFEQIPAPEWKATLAAVAGDGKQVDRLRMHTRTGRPLGSDSFLSKLETYLGRRVRAVPRGRPHGSKDSRPRTRR